MDYEQKRDGWRRRTQEVRAEILRRAGGTESGVASAEIGGWPKKVVQQRIADMQAEGILFAARLGHRTMRYFTDPAMARKYEDKHRAAPATVTTTRLSIKHAVVDTSKPAPVTRATFRPYTPITEQHPTPLASARPMVYRRDAFDYKACGRKTF